MLCRNGLHEIERGHSKPMNLYNFARALGDLFWTFFPVFVVVLILALLDKLGHLSERSDLLLASAVLFAEGWWKLRKTFLFGRALLEFFGFIGAIITVLLAALVLFAEAGNIPQVSSITSSSRFSIAHYTMLILSVWYGIVVRMRVLDRETPILKVPKNEP
jgi:hypothetical protein